MLVVLETLTPAERIAFVLHDMFDLPFEEIGPIIDRSPVATRQLASRARRRVRGAPAVADRDLVEQRSVVDAFLAAARGGNFEALLAVLDPDVVVLADAAARRLGGSTEPHGAEAVARSFLGRAQAARPVLVDGALGLVVAPRGRLMLVVRLTFANGKIAKMEGVAEPEALAEMKLATLD